MICVMKKNTGWFTKQRSVARNMFAPLLASMIVSGAASAVEVKVEAQVEDDTKPVTIVPEFIDYGLVEPGVKQERVVWVINTGTDTLNVTGAKGNCGCTTTPEFEPFALEPNEARDIKIEMRASVLQDRRSNKRLTITFDEQSPLVVDVTVKSVHPYRAQVERLKDARKRGEKEDAMELFAANPRGWFGEKSGDGVALDAFGHGPWADWDRIMRSSADYTEHIVFDGGISMVARESNEFHRLLERGERRTLITYYFDDENKISGRLVEPLHDRSEVAKTDRYDEFVAWVQLHHPDDIAAMFTNDLKINPERDSAQLWLRHLTEWSHEVHSNA